MKVVSDALALLRMPEVTVDLMWKATEENDPFYRELVKRFFEETHRRHARIPLIRQMRHGVALCTLPQTPDGYEAMIEASGRRNHRKAVKLGYVFAPIEFNDHLDDIREIRRSTDVRQGRVSEEILAGEVTPCRDPRSTQPAHDYRYFGVLKAGRLVAYAGVFVAGEAGMIQHILGHAAHQPDGIVPMLIIGIARHLREHHPPVKYYVYDTYFGAGATLRRFKKKFCFTPHRVNWRLG